MTITLDWTLLQAALVVAVFLLGLGFGWKYMAIWVLGTFIATLATDAVASKLEKLVNRFVSIFFAFGSDFSGSDLTAPKVTIGSPDLPLWQIGFLILIALPLTAFVAKWFGNKDKVGLLGKLFGGVFGALGTVILLGKVTGYWHDWVTAEGHSDPFANFHLDLPTFIVGASGSSINWVQLAGFAVIAAIGLLVLYAFWRALRLII